MPYAVLTTQTKITRQRLGQLPLAPVGKGQARLAIRQFALTANNVTYAATGFDIGYWQFFPTGLKEDGIVPVWGFAEVVESRSSAMPEGARFYGFWPMAQEVVLTPEPAGDRAVRDVAPHRAPLPAVYNLYQRVADAPGQDDAYRALLQPLVATSWLIADWLAEAGNFGAEQIIVGSASSKTGLGTCAFVGETGTRVIGLTSPGNLAFTRSLGHCDLVLPYDRVAEIEKRPSVFVDMAGNADVKRRLHAHLGDLLRHSAAVGLSHWDSFAPPRDLDGPKPQFFFAPARIAKRRQDWGPGVVETRIAEATARIADQAADWMTLVRHDGLEEAMNAFADLAEGRANPAEGHIVTLG